ncbi:phosphoribosyltransferase [Streptomyces sp. H34-S4]|uniref:phosphoribosyltransferase n=1 Tax=Streptomyces sp. H34-S4 TaxID=2996463 RepID=UPI0022710F25|nr:phosphoribosyltransferase family protein [Streptomyces sp. H34-S4]MCY0935976.1 phosphoribosyltransferase family protein [Streptomyces sp. H34-S4]
MAVDQPVTCMDWADIETQVHRIADGVERDGLPQAIVAVLRGGGTPAVWLSHLLGVRDFRAITVTHTLDDSPHAQKHPKPAAMDVAALGDLSGLDVLLVDDVAGSGDTLAAAVRLVTEAGAVRVRSAVCVVNEDNWTGGLPPAAVVTYIGTLIHGWVVFPWEGKK